jgi:hypothetical protein
MWAKQVEISQKETKNTYESSKITVAHQNLAKASTTTHTRLDP